MVPAPRLDDVGAPLTVDVAAALLPHPRALCAFRLAAPAPLRTAPDSEPLFSRRPVDLVDYAVAQALAAAQRGSPTTLGGAVELSGPAHPVGRPGPGGSVFAQHARPLLGRGLFGKERQVSARSKLPRFIVGDCAAVTQTVEGEALESEEPPRVAITLLSAPTTLPTLKLWGTQLVSLHVLCCAGVTNVAGFFGTQGALQAVDLSQCARLTIIGRFAFSGCVALTEVALPGGLTKIEEGFCAGSTALESLELSHCTQLTHIPRAFLARCSALRTMTLPPTLIAIDAGFCQHTALTTLDVSHCSALTSIGASFLIGCANLRDVALPTGLTEIDAAFCEKSGLERLDLSHCTDLRTIGFSFLARCAALRSVKLPASVTTLGYSCCEAAGLTELDLGHCTNLTRIDDRFLFDCTALRAVHLPASLGALGTFCAGTPGLKSLDLSHCTRLWLRGGLSASAQSTEVILPSHMALQQ